MEGRKVSIVEVTGLGGRWPGRVVPLTAKMLQVVVPAAPVSAPDFAVSALGPRSTYSIKGGHKLFLLLRYQAGGDKTRLMWTVHQDISVVNKKSLLCEPSEGVVELGKGIVLCLHANAATASSDRHSVARFMVKYVTIPASEAANTHVFCEEAFAKHRANLADLQFSVSHSP